MGAPPGPSSGVLGGGDMDVGPESEAVDAAREGTEDVAGVRRAICALCARLQENHRKMTTATVNPMLSG